MRFLKLNVYSAAPERWTRWAATCEAGVFQSPDWIKATGRDNGEARFFVWTDDRDEVVGVAAGQLLHSRLPLIGSQSGILALSSLPSIVAGRRHEATDFVESLANYALENGCRLLQIESQMSQCLPVDRKYLGATQRGRLEFSLRTDADESELWSRLHKQHRRKIRKAGKQGLLVTTGKEETDIAAFRGLQLSSRERRVKRGQSEARMADDTIAAIIRESLRTGFANLYLVRRDEEIISGALIASYLGKRFYVYGGSNSEGFRTNAPALLFWDVICKSQDDGVKEFNFGGVPAGSENPNADTHGLYRFKAGFGCEVRELYDLDLSLRPWANRMVGLLNAFRAAA